MLGSSPHSDWVPGLSLARVSEVSESDGDIRVTDLFAGAGGLTQGFVEASNRFQPYQAVEFDPDAAATFAENFSGAKVFTENILDWVQQGSVRDTDVVIGGPPCQGFSTLGKQQENDEKNFLWRQYTQVVQASSPRYFVMENVPQFQVSQQRDVFFEELADGSLSNYRASIWTVNTADYGTPQNRKRMIILGSRKDVPVLKLPAPTHNPDNYRTVRSAFEGLNPQVSEVSLPDRYLKVGGKNRPGPFKTSELHLTRDFTELSKKRFSKIPIGGNRFDLPDDLKAPCWIKHTTGSGDVMGRLFWDKPSVTIRTEFNKPEKGRYLHPTEDRAITHHEAARLMGFPDDFLWIGSKTSIARQIGNAVPIPLGRAIAMQILSLVDAKQPLAAR